MARSERKRYADSTGDLASGRSITGIVLAGYFGGFLEEMTIGFDELPDPRIASLSAAVSAVGSGWTSWSHPELGQLPVTELADLAAGSGAGADDRPATLAAFCAYSRALTHYRPRADGGEAAGMYEVGRRDGYGDATRWGPGGEMLFSPAWRGGIADPRRVRFTYDGGFATIPPLVQEACAEWVRSAILRLGTDLLLRRERADHYEYELNDKYLLQLMGQMPPNVTSLLSSYRLSFA